MKRTPAKTRAIKFTDCVPANAIRGTRARKMLRGEFFFFLKRVFCSWSRISSRPRRESCDGWCCARCRRNAKPVREGRGADPFIYVRDLLEYSPVEQSRRKNRDVAQKMTRTRKTEVVGCSCTISVDGPAGSRRRRVVVIFNVSWGLGSNTLDASLCMCEIELTGVMGDESMARARARCGNGGMARE